MEASDDAIAIAKNELGDLGCFDEHLLDLSISDTLTNL